MCHNNEDWYRGKHQLQSILHVLSDKPLGIRLHINAIAKMGHLHHQTTKRVIENIFAIQKLAPAINVHYLRNGRIELELKEMPAYFYDNLETQKRVLVKLYLMKAFFGVKAPMAILSREEQRVISNLENEFLVDRDNVGVSLSAIGAESAFETMENFMNMHDLLFYDPELATSQLRALEKEEEKEEMSSLLDRENLKALSEQLSTIGPENLVKNLELRQAFLKFMSSPEAKYVAKIASQISRIEQILSRRAYRSMAEDHTIGILP